LGATFRKQGGEKMAIGGPVGREHRRRSQPPNKGAGQVKKGGQLTQRKDWAFTEGVHHPLASWGGGGSGKKVLTKWRKCVARWRHKRSL